MSYKVHETKDEGSKKIQIDQVDVVGLEVRNRPILPREIVRRDIGATESAQTGATETIEPIVQTEVVVEIGDQTKNKKRTETLKDLDGIAPASMRSHENETASASVSATEIRTSPKRRRGIKRQVVIVTVRKRENAIAVVGILLSATTTISETKIGHEIEIEMGVTVKLKDPKTQSRRLRDQERHTYSTRKGLGPRRAALIDKGLMKRLAEETKRLLES